jgi:hypothetical protein
VNSETLTLLSLATIAVTAAAAVTWRLRPDLRHSRVLGSVLGISAVTLTVVVTFWVAIFVALATLPDMRDF